MRYLKVTVEGPSRTHVVYEALDPLTDEMGEYTEDILTEIGETLVANVYSWGYAVVDEDEVPDGDR